MNTLKNAPLAVIITLALSTASVAVQAQTERCEAPSAGPTRAQVVADRDAFLAAHRWDEQDSRWILVRGVEPQPVARTRSEVIAEQVAYVNQNHWDKSLEVWLPNAAAPLKSTLTRADVEASRATFMKSHPFDAVRQWTGDAAVGLTC